MTLVIEDGTGKTDSTSYASVVEARAYAAARGVTLSATDSVVESQLIKAMDYLEAQRSSFQGSKASATQALQWPRINVVIDGSDFPSTAIPNELKQAQMRLAMEVNNGVDLMPTRSGGFVKKEKIDAIETEYSEKIAAGVAPEISAVAALLAPLFSNSLVGMSLQTVRV